MKKILLINGHPGSQSLSLELAKAYLSGAKKSGADVKELHLKDINFDPILHEGYRKEQPLEKDLVNAQEYIKWADHIVIFSPVWWNNVPALLKGFIDRVLLPGFAYKFTGLGKWDKFLKGKTGRLILTTGGPAFFYKYFMRSPVDVSVCSGTLKFCGIKPLSSVVIGSAGSLKKDKKQAWLDKLNKLGQKQK